MRPLQLVLIVLAASVAQTVFAHAELVGSNPANCAMLETAPGNVTLNFSEPVRLTALSVQKEGTAKQSLGPLSSEASQQFTVAAPGLGDGHYMVSWRALSEDTHVMTGELMFVVGAVGEHGAQMSCTANAGAGHAMHGAEEHHDDHAGAH